MAIGSMNVSNNSKINNEIKALHDKDSEIINKYGSTRVCESFYTPDGSYSIVLMADVTKWYNGYTGNNSVLIRGNLMMQRGGYINRYSCLSSIDMLTTYKNNGSVGTYRLATTNTVYRPCIVSKVNDDNSITYYLALNIKEGMNMTITFDGHIQSIDSTSVSFDNIIHYSGDSLPEGYEIKLDCEPMMHDNLAIGTYGDYYDYTKLKSIDNKLGTTDISSIGDGTITGAISALKAQIDTI